MSLSRHGVVCIRIVVRNRHIDHVCSGIETMVSSMHATRDAKLVDSLPWASVRIACDIGLDNLPRFPSPYSNHVGRKQEKDFARHGLAIRSASTARGATSPGAPRSASSAGAAEAGFRCDIADAGLLSVFGDIARALDEAACKRAGNALFCPSR